MSGFDDLGRYHGDMDPHDNHDQQNIDTQRNARRARFAEFLRKFHIDDVNDTSYIYRDAIRDNYHLGEYWVEVDVNHLSSYDPDISEILQRSPADNLPLFEEAARSVADDVTRPRPDDGEGLHDIQVLLKSRGVVTSVRNLKAFQISRLVKVSGIAISASSVRSKAVRISLQCRACRDVIPDLHVNPGFEGSMLPRRCSNQATGAAPCPVDPYFIVPDRCVCVNFQTLKLQEAPDAVPVGEMPRHLQLYLDRNLCDRVVPGNRITVIGIYSVRNDSILRSKRAVAKSKSYGTRTPYLRVLGVEVDHDGPGRSVGHVFTAEDEDQIRRLAALPDIYDRIARSIAPSIFGSLDMKRAIACLLFGGSRKRLPDGLTRRGDINMLLLGDPGTAKSQLLKFAERVAPVGVYTSGKGSSAAGLTAAVMRDPNSNGFVVEGGAMVLADGGVVCIDEFDKMRGDDRVAIHEAMEQQTISIAKAGITTTLNSRCSVLAAANSVLGRWDDSRGADNIDFLPTILSRFDMIFIVKDEHSREKDVTLARHVMSIHVNSTASSTPDAEIDLATLTKYIAYCRSFCGPRLSPEACRKLQNRYVLMRTAAKNQERDTQRKIAIPITVRQLEAIVRIAESLAKMKLQPFAGEPEVEEAIRLFQVSTLDAAMTGELSGVEGFTSTSDQEELNRIERQIKRRFIVGSQVTEYAVVQDLIKQKYEERKINKVLHLMLRRGELVHRMQRKMLYRVR